MSQCLICTRDHKGSLVCGLCEDTLVDDLNTLAWLDTELLVTRTRQARIGGGGRSRDTPLGFHPGALAAGASLYRDLTVELGDWLRAYPGGIWPEGLTSAGMARWFADRPDRLRHYPNVCRLRRRVTFHIERILRVINPPPDESTFGVCGADVGGVACTEYLYAEPDASWVRCRRCKTQHDTYERRRLLEARMRSLYFRAATLARLLPLVLDRPVSASNIRNWRAEGRPIKTKLDEDGFLAYHCGDVIRVAVSTPKRDRKKAS